jgi:hypothetical protein
VRRILFVVAAGLIGLLLGVGLSLVADEIAGQHISQPVPIGLHPEATTSPASRATPSKGEQGDHERSTPSVAGGSSATSSRTPSNDTNDAGGSATDDGSTHDDD